jgi:hypothetical protein
MSRDIVPTCPEIRHGWAGRIPVAGYGPTRYAWSALQRVPVLRHGVQVAGPRTVVRRQDRRAAGSLAPATSRLAGGRVPAALRWSELHTGTQSVHVLPPPPRRPGRVRTVARANSVPLPCAVTSLRRPQQGHDTHLGAGAAALRDRARPPYGVSDHARREARVINRRTARLRPDVRAMAASAASGRPSSAPIATSSSRASRPPSRKPIRRSGAGGIRSAATRSFDAIDMDRAGRGCNRKQHGQRWPSPILERPDRKPRDHRRVGEPVEPRRRAGRPGTRTHLEPGDLAVDAVEHRRDVHQDRAEDRGAEPQAPCGPERHQARDPRPRREGRPGAPRGA